MPQHQAAPAQNHPSSAHFTKKALLQSFCYLRYIKINGFMLLFIVQFRTAQPEWRDSAIKSEQP